MGSDGERCETCRFWKEWAGDPDDDYGDCRRHPPVRDQAADVIVALSMMSYGPMLRQPPDRGPEIETVGDQLANFDGLKMPGVFPITAAEDWCGEYQPRKPLPVVG